MRRIKTGTPAAQLIIKDHEFSALVLPPACVLSRGVADKIDEFARMGGLVVLLGETPQGSPEKGMTDEQVISRMNSLKQQPNVIDLATDPDRMGGMIAALNSKIKPQIRLKNAGRLYTAHRKTGRIDLYWLANNTDSVQNFTAWMRDGKGVAEIWNCETGRIKPVASKTDDGYRKLSLTLFPYEGYWVVFNGDKKESETELPRTRKKNILSLEDSWSISYPGVETIYKTAGKILDTADRHVDPEKLKPGYDDSGWNYYRNENHPVDRRDTSKPVALKDFLYWRTRIPAGAKAVIFPEGMRGKNVWLDGIVRQLTGNRMELSAGDSLIALFLPAGDLKASLASPLRFEVGKRGRVRLNSWHSYGLQQFTGYVDYETEFELAAPGETVSLDLGKVKYMAEVFINGKPVGARLWPPFVFDLSDGLKTGTNNLRVRVGNLMIEKIWMQEDLGRLRTWGWDENPDFERYDAGLYGPVRLVITK